MLKVRAVLMDEAGGDKGAGGGGGGDAGAATAAAAADKTLLRQAGDAGSAEASAAAAAAADPLNWLPEKYRVFEGEDKKAINLEASAKKVAAAHGELEKRMGSVGAPPEKSDGYKTDGAMAALKAAAGGKEMPALHEAFVKQFNGWAHGAGLTQAQYDKALPALMGVVPQLVEQAFDNQMKSARDSLVKIWGADGLKADSEQMQDAYRAYMAYAPAALRTPEGMDQVGNNPVVLQILSSVGKELREDKKVAGEGAEGDNIHALMRTEAYWNKKHPEHMATVKKVNDFFVKGGKAAPRAA